MTREELQREIVNALAPLAMRERTVQVEDKPITETYEDEKAAETVAGVAMTLGAILFDKMFVPSVVKAQMAQHVRLTDWDEETKSEYEKIFNEEYERERVDNKSLEDLSMYIRSLEKELEHIVFVRKSKISAVSAYKANRESVATQEELKKVREFDSSSALKEAQLKTEKKSKLTKKQQQMQSLIRLGVKFDDANSFLSTILSSTEKKSEK